MATFYSLTKISDIFISWLPLYYEIKVLFTIYIMVPQTKGAEYLYGSFLQPFLDAHEEEIDLKLNNFKDLIRRTILSWAKSIIDTFRGNIFEIMMKLQMSIFRENNNKVTQMEDKIYPKDKAVAPAPTPTPTTPVNTTPASTTPSSTTPSSTPPFSTPPLVKTAPMNTTPASVNSTPINPTPAPASTPPLVKTAPTTPVNPTPVNPTPPINNTSTIPVTTPAKETVPKDNDELDDPVKGSSSSSSSLSARVIRKPSNPGSPQSPSPVTKRPNSAAGSPAMAEKSNVDKKTTVPIKTSNSPILVTKK